MTYTVQPITDFSIFTTPANERKSIQFSATWSQTVSQLARELEYIDAKDAVVEIAVTPAELRLDGTLRANAKPSHPGVRMSFQSKHGALSYTCDTYEGRYYSDMPDWQANVRAIVKTLESLRAVDRYGATKGEQYAGFKALGAGTGGIAMGGLTNSDARAVLTDIVGWEVLDDPEIVFKAWKHARVITHPDRNGGDQAGWDKVEAAGFVLGLRS